MTKDSKPSRIIDSASGGKGESMARETRVQTFAKNYYGFRRQWSPAETKEIADFAQAYALSESKGLASRVEELEKLMQEIVEAAVDGCDYCSICMEDANEHEASCVIGLAQQLLAGAHAEEKSHEL